MASPLREARDWLAQGREAGLQETGPKAAGDNNVSKPVEMLVTVPGDLTDHRRWLEEQFAAIQASRERHERWLESQRKYQEEVTKDDRVRLRRRVARQRRLRKITKPLTRAATRLRSRLQPYLADIPGGLSAGATRIGERISMAFAWAYAKSATLLRTTRVTLLSAFGSCRTKAETLSPALYGRIATAGDQVKRSASAMAASAAPIFGQTRAVLQRSAEHGSSLWRRMREAGHGQMLVATGAALLVCGALILGSGLLLRTGSPFVQDAAEPIAWSFEAPQSASNRIVFTLSGTPAYFRINGLSFRGENTLDHPLTGVEAVVKTDKPQSDLRLSLAVDKGQALAEGPHVVDAPLMSAAAGDAIPSRAPFELVFAFPGEGLSPEEFFEAYGGLTLNMRYTAEGKQRTLIQYLSPEMLKAQLADVQAMGS